MAAVVAVAAAIAVAVVAVAAVVEVVGRRFQCGRWIAAVGGDVW